MFSSISSWASHLRGQVKQNKWVLDILPAIRQNVGSNCDGGEGAAEAQRPLVLHFSHRAALGLRSCRWLWQWWIPESFTLSQSVWEASCHRANCRAEPPVSRYRTLVSAHDVASGDGWAKLKSQSWRHSTDRAVIAHMMGRKVKCISPARNSWHHHLRGKFFSELQILKITCNKM